MSRTRASVAASVGFVTAMSLTAWLRASLVSNENRVGRQGFGDGFEG